MPTVTTTQTTTTTVTIKPTLKRKLLTELKVYETLHAELKAIEMAMDKHKSAIEAIRDETGEPTIALEGFTVTRVTGQRTSLSKELLLAQGVTMSQIENATENKPIRPYTKVTTPGSKQSNQGGE